MTKPTRRRPEPTSELGRRLQPQVEDLVLAALSPAEPATNVDNAPADPGPARPPASPPAADAKESLTTRVPGSVLAAARAAVIATAGHPAGCRSLAELVTTALTEKVAQLERDLNHGQPFPTPAGFRTGRPLGR